MIPVNYDQFMGAIEDTQSLMEQDIEVRENYSGKGMFGQNCPGIVCDIATFALFCACLGAVADEWDWVGNVRSDSMGTSTIWYWPGVQLEEVSI